MNTRRNTLQRPRMPASFPRSLRWRVAAWLTLCTGTALGQTPEITLNGADSRLSDNIRAHLSVRDERCNSPARRLSRFLPQIDRDIERAAQALGFYHLQHTAEFTPGDPCWALHITVQPGSPVVFDSIQVNVRPDPSRTGNRPDPFNEMLQSSPVRRGAQLVHGEYETLKSSLSAVAVENGYFGARFNRSELSVDLSRNQADVVIDFDPGQRYHFGEIRLAPMPELSSSFVSRFLPFEEGSPYSSESLIELRQSLNDSQYFSQVAVTPELNAPQNASAAGIGGVIPVNVSLTPRPRHSWSAGVGATTDIGPRVTLAYENRYLNRQGHRLNADVSLSPVRQEPNISYVVPLRDPTTESLSFSSGYLGQSTDTFDSDTYRVGASYRSTVEPWILGEWLQNVFVNFQRENSEINDVHESSNLTISGVSWSTTRSDDPIFPSRGWRLLGQVSGASNALLSDMSFLQFFASGKVVLPAGPGRVLLRMEAATTVVDDVEQLPVSIRYFTGGDQSVRGYGYGTLGALNEQDEVIGGKHLLTGSIEYDFNILPSWKLAVFHDVGNSFEDFDDFELYRSVGLGVRWMSPIGPIRADIAHGLDDGSFRFHITMGPDL